MQDRLIAIANKILRDRYGGAVVMFLAGSIVRGEGTASSDLDLVVIFEKLSAAYRESFSSDGFPVEVFVHDPDTLRYFFDELDRKAGIPSLAQMIVEGIEIPTSSQLSQSLKRMAAEFIEEGPPRLDDEGLRNARYGITGLIDDIRHPRSRAELVATGGDLYEALADFYFRANGLWSAKGKAIPRILNKADKDFCSRYVEAFDELFANGQPELVIALADEILAPHGGNLFDGFRMDAPIEYRKPAR